VLWLNARMVSARRACATIHLPCGAAAAALAAVPPVGDSVVSAARAGALAADNLQFLSSSGGLAGLLATSPGQVLQAAAGVDELADTNQVGAIFQGTLAELSTELLAGVSSKDLMTLPIWAARQRSSITSATAVAGCCR
jgi:hypothetical protein